MSAFPGGQRAAGDLVLFQLSTFALLPLPIQEFGASAAWTCAQVSEKPAAMFRQGPGEEGVAGHISFLSIRTFLQECLQRLREACLESAHACASHLFSQVSVGIFGLLHIQSRSTNIHPCCADQEYLAKLLASSQGLSSPAYVILRSRTFQQECLSSLGEVQLHCIFWHVPMPGIAALIQVL